MMTWFKFRHDTPDDIRLRRLSPQEKWAWVALLCLASKSKERGSIHHDDEDIADYCEFPTTQDWLYFRDKLIAKGLLEIKGNGDLTVLGWEEDQRKPSDKPEAVRERVRKHRANKKAAKQQADETPCNALQGVLKRDCNATDKEGELDLDPEYRSDTYSDPDLVRAGELENSIAKPQAFSTPLAGTPAKQNPDSQLQQQSQSGQEVPPPRENHSQTQTEPQARSRQWRPATSSAELYEQRMRGIRPPWEQDEQQHQRFLQFICDRVMRGWSQYKEHPPTSTDAKGWISKIHGHTNPERLDQVLNLWGEFSSLRSEQNSNEVDWKRDRKELYRQLATEWIRWGESMADVAGLPPEQRQTRIEFIAWAKEQEGSPRYVEINRQLHRSEAVA